MTMADDNAEFRPSVVDLTDYDEWDGLVIRTDFSDDTAWRRIKAAVDQPSEFDFSGHFIDDLAWDGASADEVLAALPPDQTSVVFIADTSAMRPEHALLAVRTWRPNADADTGEPEEGTFRQFRLLPAAVGEMHINLAIANMDFEEFSWSAYEDPDRIHRGFL